MERQGLPTLNHLLQHTLRSLCTDSQWVYAVFWRIRPRNYPPPQWENEGGATDRSKGNKRNWILVWEDGFCNFSLSLGASAAVAATESPFLGKTRGVTSGEECKPLNPELFFKMSHEVYNYGEGLMGKVAADNSHKWVYREPLEHGNSMPPWHGSIDPHPRTWEAQFKAGIQTVAVVAVQEGLLQLGSTFKIVEDLNFVILMQRKFNYLQSIPGVFLPQPSSKRPVQYGGEEFPPPELEVRGNWIMSPEDHQTRCTANSFSPRAVDQFMSPKTGIYGPQSSHNSGSILGLKRRPDMDTPGLPFDFHDYPYGSSAGEVRSYSCRAEYPFHPEAVNLCQLGCRPGTLPNLLPSMSSSLQALLSKLPSVTPKELESTTCSLQRTDSPPPPHRRSDSPPTQASNYSSPPAAASPISQTNRTSPIRCLGSVASLSSSSQSDHLSSPDHYPNVADQSDSMPRICCTLNTPASDQLLSCNNNRNTTGSAHAQPATIISEPFNIDSSADNPFDAAASAAPIMPSVSITSDQRGVVSDLPRLVNVYQFRDKIAPGLIKDKLTSSSNQSFQDHPPDNLPDTYFGLQEVPENNDNYNEIFSEIY